jgi:xanthine dehydrogenase accessory factor
MLEVICVLKIFQEIERCKRFNLQGVLGTIISTEGSTYQKIGTKCFFAEDGKITELLSGGCVESDLAEYGKQVLESNQPKRIHYDFRQDEDLPWGLGVGCNGAIDIFLEPYYPHKKADEEYSLEKMFTLGISQPLSIITIVDAEDPSLIGKKWLVTPEDNITEHALLKEIVSELERKLLRKEKGLSILYSELGRLEVFFDFQIPTPNLIIFGAGPDAVSLVNGAKQLGWGISIVDHRPGYVNSENFPDADSLICCPKDSWPELTLNDNSFIVIMSHHFLQDQVYLENVLQKDVPYIGLLGPRERTNKLLNMTFKNNRMERITLKNIHSPIGLDIGAKTPEEIALSILSEMVVVYRGGTAIEFAKSVKEVPLYI